jgi:WD40-like Beta Propeller Repeat
VLVLAGLLASASLLSPVPPGGEPRVVAKVPDGCRVVEGSLRFSRDGSKCVCIVEKGEKTYPLVGGTLGPPFDEITWPTIDPNGAHSAFRGYDKPKTKRTGTYSLVYDGKVVASDIWIGPVSLDPAKGAPAFWIAHGVIDRADGSLEPQAATLQWGKYKSSKWQFAEFRTAPRFTPDGKILVTTAARGNGDWNVLTVDEKGKDDKHASGSIFDAAPRTTGRAVAFTFANLSGQGERWIYEDQHYYVGTASLDERGDKALGNVLGETYESCGSPTFSDDGLHVACKVMKGGSMGVAIDDHPGAACEFDYVDQIVFDRSGSKVGFVACKGCKLNAKHGMEVLTGVTAKGGRWFVVHDGVRSDECKLARLPSFSPDGTSFAYAAKRGEKWFACAGSKTSEPCDEVASIAWSDDGRSISYGCREGAEIQVRTLERE